MKVNNADPDQTALQQQSDLSLPSSQNFTFIFHFLQVETDQWFHISSVIKHAPVAQNFQVNVTLDFQKYDM